MLIKLLTLCGTISIAASSLAGEPVSRRTLNRGHNLFELHEQRSPATSTGLWVIDQNFIFKTESCKEWAEAFESLISAIDWNRTSSVGVIECFVKEDHEEVHISMAIEAWSISDIEYVDTEITRIQGAEILGSKIQFNKAIGVILDIKFDYFDDNGGPISPFFDQKLTLGSTNLHEVPFSFADATNAIDGDIHKEFLPYIESTFNKPQANLFRHFLKQIRTIHLSSEVRFLFNDFSALKWKYFSHDREIVGTRER